VSAHTRGPWVLDRESSGGLEPAVTATPNGYEMYVATARNAMEWCCGLNGEKNDRALCDACEPLHLAIAKAEGRS
jgi:hypothetical protein